MVEHWTLNDAADLHRRNRHDPPLTLAECVGDLLMSAEKHEHCPRFELTPEGFDFIDRYNHFHVINLTRDEALDAIFAAREVAAMYWEHGLGAV